MLYLAIAENIVRFFEPYHNGRAFGSIKTTLEPLNEPLFVLTLSFLKECQNTNLKNVLKFPLRRNSTTWKYFSICFMITHCSTLYVAIRISYKLEPPCTVPHEITAQQLSWVSSTESQVSCTLHNSEFHSRRERVNGGFVIRSI